jgi:ATPase subunit of ABC transporter with duplicated ATPase domains
MLTSSLHPHTPHRVALARALFIKPACLLLDEPTNHLDMEAVLWLEDYLAKWNRILLMVSHSQDFLNGVCTHMIHLTSKKKLVFYDGYYHQFVKTSSEKIENQWKQYKWEQKQIKSMKEYIAKFGHGTAKNASEVPRVASEAVDLSQGRTASTWPLQERRRQGRKWARVTRSTRLLSPRP